MLRDITDADPGRNGRWSRVVVIAAAAVILVATLIWVQPKPTIPVSRPLPTQHPLPRSAGLMKAAVLDRSSIWLTTGSGVAATRLWRSQDSGRNWTSVGLPVGNGEIISLQFLDSRRGYVVSARASGEVGTDLLSMTADGGLHWRSYGLPAPAPSNSDNVTLDSITFTSDGQGRALFVGNGSSGLQAAYFYTSADGQQWRLEASVDASSQTDRGLLLDGRKGPIAFADSQHGLMAADAEGVYLTTDGGRDWSFHSLIAPPGEYPMDPGSFNVAAVDGAYLVGFAFRALNSPAAAFTYQSFDNGATWSAPIADPTEDGSSAPVFAGSQAWWIAAGKSVSLTSDGGRHWLTNAIELPGNARVVALYPLDDMRVLAFAGGGVGPPQLLYETSDGGTTWMLKKPPG